MRKRFLARCALFVISAMVISGLLAPTSIWAAKEVKIYVDGSPMTFTYEGGEPQSGNLPGAFPP